MELQNFTCPNCGKSLEANPSLDTITCNACGTSFTPEMDTAKLVIHKASNIINKAMDNHQENQRLKAELKIQREQESTKTFIVGIIVMVGIGLFGLLLAVVF